MIRLLFRSLGNNKTLWLWINFFLCWIIVQLQRLAPSQTWSPYKSYYCAARSSRPLRNLSYACRRWAAAFRFSEFAGFLYLVRKRGLSTKTATSCGNVDAPTFCGRSLYVAEQALALLFFGNEN